MPIEVRELVIRARIEDTQSGPSQGASGSNGSSARLSDREIQGIVSLCVEKVMQVIKRQKER